MLKGTLYSDHQQQSIPFSKGRHPGSFSWSHGVVCQDPATSRAWANERKTVHTEFLDDIYHPAIRDFEAKSRPPSASIEQPLASQPDDMQATRVGATTPAAEDAAVPLVSTEASAPVQPRPLHDTAQLDKNLDKAKVPPPIAAKKVKGSAVVDVKIDKKLPPPVAAKKSKVASDAPKSTKEAPSKQTAKKVPPPVSVCATRTALFAFC